MNSKIFICRKRVFSSTNLKLYIPLILIFGASTCYAQVESQAGTEKCIVFSEAEILSAAYELEPLAREAYEKVLQYGWNVFWRPSVRPGANSRNSWYSNQISNSCAKDIYEAFLKLAIQFGREWEDGLETSLRVSTPWQKNTILGALEKIRIMEPSLRQKQPLDCIPKGFFVELTQEGQNEFAERALERAIDISLQNNRSDYLNIANKIKTAGQVEYFSEVLERYSLNPKTPEFDSITIWFLNLKEDLNEQETSDAIAVFKLFLDAIPNLPGRDSLSSLDPESSATLDWTLRSRRKLVNQTEAGVEHYKALLDRVLRGLIQLKKFPDVYSPFSWEGISYLLEKFPKLPFDRFQSREEGIFHGVASLAAYLTPELSEVRAAREELERAGALINSFPRELAFIILSYFEGLAGLDRTGRAQQNQYVQSLRKKYLVASLDMIPWRLSAALATEMLLGYVEDHVMGRDPLRDVVRTASHIQNPLALDSFKKMIDRVKFHNWSGAAFDSLLHIQNEDQKRRFDFVLDHTGNLNWQDKVYWLATSDEMSKLDEARTDDFSWDGIRMSYAESIFRMLVKSGSNIDWMPHVWGKLLNVTTKAEWSVIHDQLQLEFKHQL